MDMGLNETPFRSHSSVSGCKGPMTRTRTPCWLATQPTFRAISPDAADRRPVSLIPSNVVGWVSVEPRGTNGTTLVTKSAFLSTGGKYPFTGGQFGDHDGDSSSGYYFIVIKHRNHLAVMLNPTGGVYKLPDRL